MNVKMNWLEEPEENLQTLLAKNRSIKVFIPGHSFDEVTSLLQKVEEKYIEIFILSYYSKEMFYRSCCFNCPPPPSYDLPPWFFYSHGFGGR